MSMPMIRHELCKSVDAAQTSPIEIRPAIHPRRKPINRWWDINSGAGLVCLKMGLGKSSYIRGIRSSARCGVLAAQIGLRQATRRSVLRTLTPVHPVPGCRLYAYRSSIRLLKSNGLSYFLLITPHRSFISLSPCLLGTGFFTLSLNLLYIHSSNRTLPLFVLSHDQIHSGCSVQSSPSVRFL